MRKKYIIILIGFLLLGSAKHTFSQTKVNQIIDQLSNEKVRFDFLKIGVTSIGNNKISLPKIVVRVVGVNLKSFSNSSRKEVLIKALIAALDDPKKDWNANLLLYEITDKDATPLVGIQDKDAWQDVRYMEIKYWKRLLIEKSDKSE